MNSLPAVDLGLMADHLIAHEGVINKLELYQTKVTNATLKEIIVSHTSVMRDHVRVMLALINPYLNEHLELTPINEYFRNFYMRIEKEENNNFQDKRSEEHTSELQSRGHLVCRILLVKK